MSDHLMTYRAGSFDRRRFTPWSSTLLKNGLKLFGSTLKIITQLLKLNVPFVKKNKVKNAPGDNTIRRLYAKFVSCGSLSNASHASKQRTRRSDENIKIVQDSVEGSPKTSSVRRSQELGIPRTTLRRIIRCDLNMFPYKIQICQKLNTADYPRRLNYAKWSIELAENERDFWQKIIMSDEAHFSLNGGVNKQNYRFYATENPQVIEQHPLYDQKITVWCGICADMIIGPYFFESANGATVSVNGERYRTMITDFVMPIVRENHMCDYWFQQDGATCHTARPTINLLRQLFPGRLISKNGDFDWPPRSPDLTPPDFYLWGYLKSRVYANKPRTLTQLKMNIRREIAAISTETLTSVMENVEKRASLAVKAKGSHLRDIIFKK